MENFISVEKDISLFFQVRICLIVTAVNVYQTVFLIAVNLHFIRHQWIQPNNITSAVSDNLCIGIAVDQQMGH